MVAKADWSQEKQNRLVDLYQSGVNLASCCQEMQAGQVVVLRYLKLNNTLPRPAWKSGWSIHKIELCVRLYKKGKTQREIAQMLRASQGHVGKILAEAGIVWEFRWTPERAQKLIDLYQSGLPLAECCRRLSAATGSARPILLQHGIEIREQLHTGEKNWNWKNGRSATIGGYVYLKCPGHPRAKNGYVLEHHLVMEQHLGRYLAPLEVIHHRDKNKHNNQLENLQLFASNGEHLAFELKGQTPRWSEEGRKKTREAHQRWCEEQRIRRQSKTDAPH